MKGRPFWVVLLMATFGAAAHGGPALDRATFDAIDASINGGDGYKAGRGGVLAWGESYIMLAYVEMYRATGDVCYLDKLVDHADSVLAQRDDRRGFRDWSGRSRPAWSVGEQYTVAVRTVKDRHGTDVLKFRSTRYAYNDQTTLHFTPNEADGSFDLEIRNAYWKIHETYRGLRLDREAPDFVERRVNARDRVAIERPVQFGNEGSSLVTVELLADGTGLPTGGREADGGGGLPLAPLVMAYHGYSGQCTFPMLEFAWEVRRDPRLADRYGEKARQYVAAAVDVFRDADQEWRDGPEEGEGYYVFGERGCPFWADNVGKPFNYLCGEGRSLVRLARLTGDPHWKARSLAIARLFKRHLRQADNGTTVWNYWWGAIEQGWTRENAPSFNTPVYSAQATVEDTSHGALEVGFAHLCAEEGWVFDAADMKRLAGTFLENIVDENRWTMNTRVDGSGEWGRHDAAAGRWIVLARWNRSVAEAAEKIYREQQIAEQRSGSVMLGVARLVKWSRQAEANRP